MKILVDIGHPAHVHLFKNIAWQMEKNGHAFFFSVREGENEHLLMEKFGFNYKSIGKKRRTNYGKILGLFYFSFKIFIIALRFKPDIFLSHGSMYAGLAAFLIQKPHIALEDTGNMEQIRISKPVSSVILSPQSLPVNLGIKHLRYKGFHELAYLHPEYFTPDLEIYKTLGLQDNEQYCIIRFGAWRATHDKGHTGFTNEQKLHLVTELNKILKVFITSETSLPKELLKFQVNIHPTMLHQALTFAKIVISEGATISSECVALGTPVIYVSSINVYTINEFSEKYNLAIRLQNGAGVLEKALEIVHNNNPGFYKSSREKFISDHINVTKFLIWFIENYPESSKIMRENPDYQYRFK